jgi:hypothetical protein
MALSDWVREFTFTTTALRRGADCANLEQNPTNRNNKMENEFIADFQTLKAKLQSDETLTERRRAGSRPRNENPFKYRPAESDHRCNVMNFRGKLGSITRFVPEITCIAE